MADVTIYHNPACGTARNTLALIRHAGIGPIVIKYLKTPPTKGGRRPLKLVPSPAPVHRPLPSAKVRINVLRHVRPHLERQAAEEIADRVACPDFDEFQPMFDRVEQELSSGVRKALRFGRDTSIDKGNFFVVGGQLAYVANVGETFKAPNGESDARLRVVYANGTESNLLRRSLQRALYKDESGRHSR